MNKNMMDNENKSKVQSIKESKIDIGNNGENS